MSTSFEKHARDQFEQHKVSVDVEALWDQVYPQVKEEKKDRKFLWFFLSGFLVSLALFSAFYFLQNEEVDVEKVSATTMDTSISFTENVNSSAIAKNENTENTAGSTSTKDSKHNVHNNTFTKNDNNQDFIKNTTAISPTNGLQTEAIPPQEKANGSNIKTTEKNPITQNQIKELDNKIAKTGDLQNPVSLVDESDNSVLTKKAISKNTVASGLVVKNTFSLNGLSLYSIPTLPFNTTMDIQYPDLQGLGDNKGLPKDSPLNGMRFGIGTYVGFGKTTSEITADNDPTSIAYQSLRKNSEEQLETLHFGLEAILESKQNLYLRSGVEYTRIASLFSKETDRITMDSIPGIVEIRINEITNDTLEIEGFQQVTTTESYRKKTYNYFHIVDIPVVLGYHFEYENWQIGLEAGIMTNVYLQRKGNIFAPDETFYDIATDNNKWYTSNIAVTPFAGLSAAYQLSDNFQIHVSPGFRFKRAFTTSQYPGKVNLASLSVRAGARYFF